ncbi:unnamed protein product [Bursaphelenchus xylophilus]|uniref:(pine wood nematode) hypothetical protein n=1 Tax=Bursaphelenchus xylophilus TaxID=6326 RepID=A0A1I7RPR8_BURXY|nr:unnamed protein product [Bursaphelenchus xylophilus]CAG9096504.1 unnamed protein product [Bursaphelenchus xylophilus]
MLTLFMVLNLLMAVASLPFKTEFANSPTSQWSHGQPEVVSAPEKRRLVVRVPFAQNPDSIQLSRIYKSLFTQQKQKKLKAFNFSLRNLLD